MREIKFRAWYKQSKCMIPVSNLDFEDGFHAMLSDGKNDFLCTPEQMELMEFTGLLDKHEREIYEGDILEAREYWGERDYGVVIWDERQLQWYLTRNGHPYEPLRSPFADRKMAFEIVGNIYENPELVNARS